MSNQRFLRKILALIISLIGFLYTAYAIFVGINTETSLEGILWFGGLGISCFIFSIGLWLAKQWLYAAGAVVMISIPWLSLLFA